ncbi:MAG: glycosyltransferase [Anaerolineales bacterium]|nr:MAG: glycosyltransferase [Anaerolineales bacterium]
MNILHIYKDYFPVLGGIENHIKVLAEAQVAAGHQVIVLVCDLSRHTRIENLNGVRVIKAGRITTAASMPLSLSQPLILARLRPDIVHIQSPYPLGETANWLLGHAKATVITYQSDVVRQRGWLRFYGPFLRRVLRAADRIIATSPRYIESSPWLQPVRERCTVIPNGVDVTRFVPSSRHRTGPPTLVFVGRLRYYKGLDTLLRAMPHVPEASLTIVGEGPMREEWQALSQELGLAGRVTFVGEVDDADLPDYYQQADLFVFPSNARSEAFGIALIEAMACGLPCIATELGTGTSWVVQDGITGLVVPPADPLALAEAITTLLQDPTRRQAMGQAGRERVVQHFSVEQVIRKVGTLYEELLGDS